MQNIKVSKVYSLSEQPLKNLEGTIWADTTNEFAPILNRADSSGTFRTFTIPSLASDKVLIPINATQTVTLSERLQVIANTLSEIATTKQDKLNYYSESESSVNINQAGGEISIYAGDPSLRSTSQISLTAPTINLSSSNTVTIGGSTSTIEVNNESAYITLNSSQIKGACIDVSELSDESVKIPTSYAVTNAISAVYNDLSIVQDDIEKLKNKPVNPSNNLDLILASNNKIYKLEPRLENNTPTFIVSTLGDLTEESFYSPCYVAGEDGISIYQLKASGAGGLESIIVTNITASATNFVATGIGLMINGSDGLSYQLIPAGEPGYEYFSLTCVKDEKIPVTSINLDNGDAIVEDNTVHSIIIDKDTNFILPTLTNGTFAQVLVCAKVIASVNITFGTTHFFNDEIPTIESNANYDILFEHDPIENVWVCGAIKKG